MTINTTEGVEPAANSDAPIEPPLAGTLQTSPGVQHAPSEPDLQSRIATRRAELIARLRDLKTDTHREALEAAGRIRAHLSELAHLIKWGIVDDWASVSGPVAHKLEQWLAESARHVTNKKAHS